MNIDEHAQKLTDYRQEIESLGHDLITSGRDSLQILSDRLDHLNPNDADITTLSLIAESFLLLGDRFLSLSLGIEKLLELI
ncbi:hypothetical protein H6G80_03950 [Nostoc sp. FACHB-87]|uniref:hypothetical protein n=1 Tax=Nostocaceae TaxID=1162 RepID=UPI001685D43E|nr:MULTISPECIES: hypothetical protein [Nostocaceae]MBD2298944.1 hypothetical protein [Nostoc sp. FACHB-190]MBD2453228.1 hypothetical protein [Nostoc sp. FACHB-87]MBD2474992.1 hypothetical protein [Anabaena sp. FACHB-83]